MKCMTSDSDVFRTDGEDSNIVGEIKYLISSGLRKSIMSFSSLNYMVSEMKGYYWHKKNKLSLMCFS